MWWSTAARNLNTSLKPLSQKEAYGPCPTTICTNADKADTDGFRCFQEGNYWCRKCNKKGWWDTKEEIKQYEPREVKEEVAPLSEWERYHTHPDATTRWGKEGFTEEEVKKYKLGYCPTCPVMTYSDSLTIPITYHGQIVDIRHRLLNPNGHGKYTSHNKIPPVPAYNLDALYQNNGTLYIVEGEKKAIRLIESGYIYTIGLLGLGYAKEIGKVLNKYRGNVVLVLDPDVDATRVEVQYIVKMSGGKVYVVELWEKPDDFILEYGVDMFHNAVQMARRLK